MKWIKRKLRKWVMEEEYDGERACDYGRPVSVDETSRVDKEAVLNFRIFSAQNGVILEFNSYSEKKDRRSHSTYIINEGDDIADYVRQNLPMEMLKVSQ